MNFQKKILNIIFLLHTFGTLVAQYDKVPLNYQPRGMYTWDTWFLQKGDTTHMFHLQIKKPGSLRSDNENETIGHAISTDLIHWKELPTAIYKGKRDNNSYDDGPLYTGSAIYHDGVFYNFYCGNSVLNDNGSNKPSLRQSMNLATSTDGIHFKKYKNNPIIEPPKGRYYNIHEQKAPFSHHAHNWVDCRDLLVIKDPKGDGWLGYNVMRRQGQKDAEHSSVIALCRSKDLFNWTVEDPVATPNRFNCFEVPDVFEIDNKWYMIALTGDNYGQDNRWSDKDITHGTIVFEADSPYGPFEEIRDNLLLSAKQNIPQGFSARTVLRNGERLMLYSHAEEKLPNGRLSWALKLVPRKEGGLNPVYWKGNDNAFVAQSIKVPKIRVNSLSEKIGAFTSDDSVYMFQTNIKTEKNASIVFGKQETRGNSSYSITLSPSLKRGKGKLMFGDSDGMELTSRYLDIIPNETYKLRLVVVDEVLSIYVDDVMLIDYYVKGLQPGGIALKTTEEAEFNELEYNASKQDSIKRARVDPKAQIRLHYRPDDGYFGDAIPFYWDGAYHVFYLKLSKDGNTGWEHISSKDLVNWEVHPTAINTHSLTGSIIEKDGIFHAFYTNNGISKAISTDLINWDLDQNNPIIPMDKRYSGTAWRDPHVFWNEVDNCYWMLVCAHNPSDKETPFTGSVALVKSKDLKEWEVFPPLWSPQFSTVIECPDIFKHDDKWVMQYYWGETRIRLSDSPLGPWKRPKIEAPNSFGFSAGKTMFDGHRRIEIGWMQRYKNDAAEGTWAGNMLLPREWYLLGDGTPAVKCPEEVINAYSIDPTKNQGAKVFQSLKSYWKISTDMLTTDPGIGQSSLIIWKDAPEDYLLKTKIRFNNDASVKFLLRGNTGKYETPIDHSYALELDPLRNEIRLHEEYHWNQRIDLKSIRYDFNINKPTSIQLFLDGDILEVFIDNKRSLVHRLLKYPKGSLGIMVRDYEVVFEDFEIMQLPKSAINPLPIPISER